MSSPFTIVFQLYSGPLSWISPVPTNFLVPNSRPPRSAARGGGEIEGEHGMVLPDSASRGR